MASLRTPNCCSCMILFMSVALLVVLLPLQAHGATVQFTYCNPLDPFNFLVKNIDVERVRTPIGEETVTFQIQLAVDIMELEKLCTCVLPETASPLMDLISTLQAILPSGEILSSVNESLKYEQNLIIHNLSKDWIARTAQYPGLYYQIVLAPPTGEVLMCVNVAEVPT